MTVRHLHTVPIGEQSMLKSPGEITVGQEDEMLVETQATDVNIAWRSDVTELKAENAEYVYARGCTALTELKAENAKTVDVSGCTALTELKAENAEYVYASGCTALTELKAENAKTVDARGCTALDLAHVSAPIARKIEQFIADDLVPLLSAAGRFEEAIKPRHWECHKWQNCPMAAAFGVTRMSDIPSEHKTKASFFVEHFDRGLIRRDMVPGIAI